MISDLLSKLNKKTRNNALALDNEAFTGSCFNLLFYLLNTRQIEITLSEKILLVDKVIKLRGETTIAGFKSCIDIDFFEDDSGLIQYALSGNISKLSLKSFVQALMANGYVSDGGIALNCLPDFDFDNVSISSDSNSQTFGFDIAASDNKWDILTDVGIACDTLGLSFSFGTGGYKTQFCLKSKTQLAGLGELDINLHIPLSAASEVWSLSVPQLPECGNLIEAISSFIQAGPGFSNKLPSLDSLLPDSFKQLDLQLSDLSVAFNPMKRHIYGVGFSVVSNSLWKIKDNILLDNIFLRWDIDLSAPKGLNADLSGKLSLGKTTALNASIAMAANPHQNWVLGLSGSSMMNGLKSFEAIIPNASWRSLQLPDVFNQAIDMDINRLELAFNPLTPKQLFSSLTANISVKAEGEFGSQLKVSNPMLGFHYDHQTQAMAAGLELDLAIKNIHFHVMAGFDSGKWLLTGLLADEVEIPVGSNKLIMQNARLKGMTLDIDPKTKDYSLSGEMSACWGGLLPSTETALTAKMAHQGGRLSGSIETDIELSSTKYSASFGLENGTVKGALSIQGKIDLADLVRAVISDEAARLLKEYLNVTIADETITILMSEDGKLDLSFNGTTSFDFNGIVFEVDTIGLHYERAAKGAKAGWSFKLGGGINIPNVLGRTIVIKGDLKLVEKGGVLDFDFEVTQGSVLPSLPLPLPNNPKNNKPIEMALKDFAVDLGKDKSDDWFLSASAEFAFCNMYESLEPYIAKQATKLSITVNSQEASLAIDNLTKPLSIPAKISLQGGSASSIDLGTLKFNFDDFSIAIGKKMNMSVDFDVYLPKQFNAIFGQDKKGRPKYNIFKTYDSKDKGTVIKMNLAFGENGLSARLLTSPFNALNMKEGYCTCSLGRNSEYGEIKFKMPVFGFNEETGIFRASGGFDIKKNLALPTYPVTAFLKACHLDELAEDFDQPIPIEDIHLLNNKKNGINISEFEKLWGKKGMPSEVKNAVRKLDGVIAKLPKRFRDYLTIEIPESLYFDVSVGMEGNVKFDISVYDPVAGKSVQAKARPVRLMYPSFTPLPCMNGLEFRSISFGELLSGELFSFSIDAVIDQFDMLTLAAAAFLPSDQLKHLTGAKALQKTLTLKNLFMIIIWQTEIPIPVPLFFDDIGLDYAGIEGVRLSTHIGFPRPSVSVSHIGRVLSGFEKFLTDRKYLLDGDALKSTGVDLRLEFGPNYLQMPKYLGARVFGNKKGFETISGMKTLAHLLNWCKQLTLNELIQAFPLGDRVGTETLDFIGIQMNVSWLITTPYEFKNSEHKQFGIKTIKEAEPILRLMPGDPSKKDQGAVMLLKGAFDDNLFSLKGLFVLNADLNRGFGTMFRFEGKVAEIIDMNMFGQVMIDTRSPSPQFDIDGNFNLLLAGKNIFCDQIRFNNNGLYVSGCLNLNGYFPLVNVLGTIKGNVTREVFHLVGKKVQIMIGGSDVVRNGSVSITNTNGVDIQGTIFGVKTRFDVMKVKKSFIIKAVFARRFDLNPDHGPTGSADVTVTLTISVKEIDFHVKGKGHLNLPFGRSIDPDINFFLDCVPSDLEQAILDHL